MNSEDKDEVNRILADYWVEATDSRIAQLKLAHQRALAALTQLIARSNQRATVEAQIALLEDLDVAEWYEEGNLVIYRESDRKEKYEILNELRDALEAMRNEQEERSA
jgi:nitrate reductase NapAB chaperone NapD